MKSVFDIKLGSWKLPAHCNGCVYRGCIGGNKSNPICDYISITKHSRPCPIEGCTVKQEDERKMARVSVDVPAVKFGLNHGYSAKTIAKLLGIKPDTVHSYSYQLRHGKYSETDEDGTLYDGIEPDGRFCTRETGEPLLDRINKLEEKNAVLISERDILQERVGAAMRRIEELQKTGGNTEELDKLRTENGHLRMLLDQRGGEDIEILKSQNARYKRILHDYLMTLDKSIVVDLLIEGTCDE